MNYINNSKERNSCKPDIDCAKCEPKPPKTKDMLIACGDGTGSVTFTSSDDAPFQLAHVAVDTTSSNRSEALIKFSSLVKVELVADAIVRLKYELFRVCDGRQPLSIGVWMYEKEARGIVILESIEESFNFIFCECQANNDRCDYFVTVTPIELTGDGVTAAVSNGRMAALTQSLCDDLEKKEKSDITKTGNLEPQKIILSCGEGSSVSQNIFPNISVPRPPVSLAQVTLDTSCLNKPRVLVEFSSVIGIYNKTFNNIALQFELFRICGGSEPISCGIWTFEETVNEMQIISGTQLQYPFSFIFCECQNISKCCIYFVTVTVLQASVSLQPFGPATWEICNTKINAYAQSSKDDTYMYNRYKTLKAKDNCGNNSTVHPKPKKAILECGNSNGSRSLNSPLEETSFQLAQVTIDTSNLCKPMVNIEFSSTVSFNAESSAPFAMGELQYELFRSCEGGTPISIGTWTLDRFPIINNISAETFSFTYCDCTTCPGCCDYFVTVTRTSINVDTNIIDPNITVGNGMIAALAQES